jgi:hypothetical protein
MLMTSWSSGTWLMVMASIWAWMAGGRLALPDAIVPAGSAASLPLQLARAAAVHAPADALEHGDALRGIVRRGGAHRRQAPARCHGGAAGQQQQGNEGGRQQSVGGHGDPSGGFNQNA